MDKNIFLNILKTITDVMKCPSCGHPFELEEVQFISQMDGFCLVHLNCSHCKMPVWVNFFSSNNKPKFSLKLANKTDIFDLEEITSDDIISFHETLRNFDGDFKRVFEG